MARPNVHETWTVLEHGPIAKVTENLWRVEGCVPRMSLRRVMTLARRDDGRLVIHSAIALNEEEMQEIEAWGTPRYLVVPNGWHRLDAPAFVKRYPDLEVFCPAGARKAVEQVVPVAGDYSAFPGDDTIGLEHVEGTNAYEGVMKIRSADGVTLVFNDLIFNMPHQPGFGGFMMKLMGSSGGLKVTRIGRLMTIKNRGAVRGCLERLAETPGLKRIIVSHHRMVAEGAADALRGVAATL